MSFLGSLLAASSVAIFSLVGCLLVLRFLLSFRPGSYWGHLRRRVFLFTQPWLEPIESWVSLRVGGVEWAPLVAACLCFLLARGLAPWFFLLGTGLSGG